MFLINSHKTKKNCSDGFSQIMAIKALCESPALLLLALLPQVSADSETLRGPSEDLHQEERKNIRGKKKTDVAFAERDKEVK